MIRLSFAGVVFGTVVFASAAFSADMPLKAPIRASAAPAFSWTGCYIGGHCVGFLGPGPFAFNGGETRVGWTVGAGAELAFAQNWSAKLEYSYYDFGNQTPILSDRIFGTQPIGVEQTIHTVKVGLNYRFWTDA